MPERERERERERKRERERERERERFPKICEVSRRENKEVSLLSILGHLIRKNFHFLTNL